MNITARIKHMHPDAIFYIKENDYESIVWGSSDITQPTLKQLKALPVEADNYFNNEQKNDKRRKAYALEADPLYFKWQRGEATEQEWLNKVSEIKARY